MDNSSIEEKLLPRLAFNPGLTLTGFRTTRPWEFASTSNNCSVAQKNLNSIKSTVQSLNITRADPKVTQELFTIKLNSSKP